MGDFLKERIENLKKWGRDYGKLFFIFVCFVIFIFSIYLIFSFSPSRNLKVSFLDVGQGDAIYIESPTHKKMIIDGGPSNIVLERLNKEMNFYDKDIDVLLETHPDSDHITGLIPILENYNVKNIVMSKAQSDTSVSSDLKNHIDMEVKDSGAIVHVAKTGDQIDFGDGVVVKVLYPASNYVDDKNTNDGSVSVEIDYGNENFLLTADLPSNKEDDLIATGMLSKNITIYKAGHHGSKTANSEKLLSYISPYYSVISAGKNNRYGLPNEEIVDRLKKYSKAIFSTIDLGTIEFATDGNNMEVSSH